MSGEKRMRRSKRKANEREGKRGRYREVKNTFLTQRAPEKSHSFLNKDCTYSSPQHPETREIEDSTSTTRNSIPAIDEVVLLISIRSILYASSLAEDFTSEPSFIA